ncbi:sulfatase-like hydrolase/transferase [Haloferula sp.]|uniref:sulfatase-like hydrolase/transferase n=1 Tax=Haloferula sp. TaxID=2497595 RepID=UPI00329D9EF4
MKFSALFAIPLLFLLPLPLFATGPNIIFFLTDDLGYGDLGSFWQDSGSTSSKKFDTPGLDTMAAEGAKLTHHYIGAPVCASARASFFQGRHQGHSDVRNSQFDKVLADNHTIASVLKSAGYRTIHVGKNGLAGGENGTDVTGTGSQNLGGHPLDRGFDEFFGYLFHGDGHEHYPRNGTTEKTAHIYNGYQQVTNASVDLYTTDAWTAYAKDAIIREVQDGDSQPFFLYIAYDSPHFKMQRPAVAYPALETDGNPLTGGVQWTTATDGSSNVRYASTADGTGSVDGYTHPDIPGGWSNSEKQHVGMIRRIDNSVADILQLLKELDIDEDTICVFTSDNGPHNEGNNPRTFESFADMEGIKRDMLEAGIRVPTIVHWPTHLPSATGNENNIAEIAYPSGIWDWMPTFLDLAGVEAPAFTDGVSLAPTLTGSGTQRDKGYLYFEFERSQDNTPNWATYFPNHANEARGQMQVIRIGDHSGIRRNISSSTDLFEIYDVVNDPGQGEDLAGSRSDLQAQMQYLGLAARRKGAGVTRPYDSAQIPPVTVPATTAGLEYESFVGPWNWLPEFRDMVAGASGFVADLDLSIRPQDDNFGIAYTGYVSVPTAGAWTFHLSSDTGAGLWVHDGHVIDDDFNHPGASHTVTSDTVYLEAGLHPIRIYYHHTTGARSLGLEWEGPSQPRETVPASSFQYETPIPPGPPTANPDTSQTEGSTSGAGSQVSIDVLANDTDDGTPAALSISSLGTPRAGTAIVSGSVVLYTPDQGFFGIDRFDYEITDGADTDTASIEVNVFSGGEDYWYPLDEVSGSTTAEAGGGRFASLVNFPGDSSQWVSGKFRNALSFDSGPDKIEVTGFTGISGSADRTVSAWINTSIGGTMGIMSWGNNANGNKWSFLVQGGTLRLEVTGGYRHGATVINDGQWHHVACTFADDGSPDADDLLLYIDGVLETNFVNTSSQSINTGSSATVVIGTDVQGRSFNGLLDDARIYARALTPTEIAELANQDPDDHEGNRWYLRNLGSPTPDAADWEADTDGDGRSVFKEFALGDSPHWFDPAAYPWLSDESGDLLYTYKQRLALSPSIYAVETSIDLSGWIPLIVAPEDIATQPASDPEFEEIMIGVPTTASEQFFRLSLTP